MRFIWIFLGLNIVFVSFGNAFEVPKFNSESKLTNSDKPVQPSGMDERQSETHAVQDGFKLIHAEKDYSDLAKFPMERKGMKKEKTQVFTQEEIETSKVYLNRKFEEFKRMFKEVTEDFFYNVKRVSRSFK